MIYDDSLCLECNENGELRLGHNHDTYTPQCIDHNSFPNKTIKSIHLGFHHTLVLMNDGSLYAWGENYRGQLGLGHYNNRQNTPQRIDLNNFHNKAIKSIHTGSHHTLALMENNSLYAWGHNYYGQLGLGHNKHQSTPQLIDPSHYENQAIQSIHTKFHHTLALMEDNSLYAWGRKRPQLGLGHNTYQTTPQLINHEHFHNKKIKSIHPGYEHNLTFMEDNFLYAWGENESGQLGLGHTDNQNTPQLIGRENFPNKTIQSIHLGYDHTLALMNDGSLFAWGYNNHGQLGLGHNNDQNTPQLINPDHFPNKTIQSIHLGFHHTLALMDDVLSILGEIMNMDNLVLGIQTTKTLLNLLALITLIKKTSNLSV